MSIVQHQQGIWSNKPIVIMGIDPGVSTGVAIATMYNPNTLKLSTIMTATCIEPEQVWDYIRPPVQILIIEKFSAQLISKYGIQTVEIIGGVKALCAEHNIKLIEDTPQQRKPYLEKARSLVPLRENHTIHEVDALAHVVRYLYSKGYMDLVVV